MATDFSSSLTVKEGLVRITTAERFEDKPRSDANTHVIVLEKKGKALRHYCTLRPDRDYRWSIGERIWGNFVCYIVDLKWRELHVKEYCDLADHLHKLHISLTLPYRATDGEMVTLGVDDALTTLRDEVLTMIQREVVRLTLKEVTEDALDLAGALEQKLLKEQARFKQNSGLEIRAPRIGVNWGEEILAKRRAAEAKKQAWIDEDADRQRAQKIQKEDRQLAQSLDKEDIRHIDEVIHMLGLQGVPADLRLRLHAMPREQALKEIIGAIEEQRKTMRGIMATRMREEYELLRKMIDDNVLEGMDLVDFGKGLLDRYQHSWAREEVLGMPPHILFGDLSSRPKLSSSQAKSTSAAANEDEDIESTAK